eukprot:TRINITY_DN81419_c0_g1_i1.p1 TRINITY_DN81419_c0_g1~~TRINITY_DN81419_c0_g1_i1.p1  ORF type:complete len:269 (-),score=58.48 TRINITY_DN81419_c0_g1_i1:141-911(-)
MSSGLKHLDMAAGATVVDEAFDKLGGEPLKIEASPSSKPAEGSLSGSPSSSKACSPVVGSQSVKLELPVKLLRLDASVQIAQYEPEEEEEDPLALDVDALLGSSPASEYLPPPERSKSVPDVWTSPLAGAWSPWVGMRHGGLQPLMDPFAYQAGYGSLEDPLDVVSMVLSPESSLLESQGSALHGTGRCRPCAWFWKPGSCQNEANCSYCHLCPEGELKNRKKAKVAMMRLGIVTPKAKGADTEVAGNVLNLSSLL